MGKKSRSKILDHNPAILETLFFVKILKFFDADADPGFFLPWIREENIRIRDKHPGSGDGDGKNPLHFFLDLLEGLQGERYL
jgi:hypothetical protein